MRYVLRADASQSIGAGHVMRSSAIAEELITRKKEVIFVGQITEIPWITQRINSLGFSQILSTFWDFVPDPRSDVLILDTYTLPTNDPNIEKSKWKSVVAIVDALTPGYQADLLIHPGFSTDWFPITNTKFLTGPSYIPFRKSIKKTARLKENTKLLQILVIGGGTDSFNFVEAICMELKFIQADFHVTVFTNNAALANLDSRFTAIPVGVELDEYADMADLVFTTASTTSLEFIAREIAVGIGCAVDNQEEYYHSLISTGVASPIGRFLENNWIIDQQRLTELVNFEKNREVLQQRCAGLIDLKGAGRIANEILLL
jgi:spore coat polysaccharide biosynthesis predicted glycosyltransferase SpsG